MRRKGELSPAGIDRGWPHQVIMPRYQTAPDLGRYQSLCPRHHTAFTDDAWHYIYCFADPADAADCAARYKDFGARPFDPKRRGRGNNLAQIKE